MWYYVIDSIEATQPDLKSLHTARPTMKPYWIACMIIIAINSSSMSMQSEGKTSRMEVDNDPKKNCPLNKRPLGKGHNLFDVKMRLTNIWWMIVKVKIWKTSIFLVGGSLILVSILYYLNWHWMYWMYRFSTNTLLLISSFCVKFWFVKFAGEVASQIEIVVFCDISRIVLVLR